MDIVSTLKLDQRTIHRHLTPLEKEDLVEGEYFQDKTSKHPVIMKRYRLTTKGKQILKSLKTEKAIEVSRLKI